MSFLKWSLRRQVPVAGSDDACISRRSGFAPSRPLAFMHVPKTAGTALIQALMAGFGSKDLVTGFDRSLLGSFDNFSSMAPGEQDRIYHSVQSLPPEAKLVLGHFAYSTLRSAYPAAQIITVLRHPVTRLLSHWLYWRQHTDDMLAPIGGWADFVRVSRGPFVDFLTDPKLAAPVDNVALRMILWQHPLISPTRFIDPAHDEQLFAAAADRLADFAFLDIVENPAFITNLNAWLGMTLTHERHNETDQMPSERRVALHDELTDEAYAHLAARSRLDLRLWHRIAAQVLPAEDVTAVVQRSLLRNFARYGALMAG